MKQHTQTILADPIRNDGHDKNGVPGDCYRTSIACLLDLEIEEVPHFGMADGWWEATMLWAEARGDRVYYLPLRRGDRDLTWDDQDYRTQVLQVATDYTDGLLLLGGPSPRGPFGHEVVGNTSLQTVWDPHPSRAGLLVAEDAIIWFPGGAK